MRAHTAALLLSLPVLLYHRIDAIRPTLPAITQRLTVEPRVFAAQMEWLHANGWHAITATQAYDALERGLRLPPRSVLITFDDGYRDVLRNAAPVLRRLHMPAVAFVITDRISGPDPSFLTWLELARLERDGVAVGSHTVTHRDLTALPPGELTAELVDSRRALEGHLHVPVPWLAYPRGGVDAAVLAAAQRAGYLLAFTTVPGSGQDAARPLLLHRDEILDGTSLSALLGR
jgi:peptidoglycan/xylan/chitin deacetylase (PgdA/CDA1 family)